MYNIVLNHVCEIVLFPHFCTVRRLLSGVGEKESLSVTHYIINVDTCQLEVHYQTLGFVFVSSETTPPFFTAYSGYYIDFHF